MVKINVHKMVIKERLKEIAEARHKAINIMNSIADYFKKPKMFDCKNGDTKWYDIEDMIAEIILSKSIKD